MVIFRLHTKMVFLIVAILLVSCKDEHEPVVPSYTYEEFITQVREFSGMCYNQDKTALLAVSDEGEIYEINFDGTTRRKLPYKGNHDFEAITINHATGEIYVADEGNNKIFMLASTTSQTLTEIVNINVGKVKNNGIEGVSYGADTLFIVNQQNPIMLIKYCLSDKTCKYITLDENDFTNLSDICYDQTDGTLWILDSQKKRVSHCNSNGKMMNWQSVDMITQPEALLVDSNQKTIWIGCDPTRKLYKIKLTI